MLILASTAKTIDEHRPINVVSQPGIEPGTLWFQDNYETQNATMTSMERSKVGTKEKRSPDFLYYPYQNTIMINIICKYFKRNGKVQLNSINNQKLKNHSPSPIFFFIYTDIIFDLKIAKVVKQF